MAPNPERNARLVSPVTHHTPTRHLRFFLTAPSPCPYLPDRKERKVFAHLPMAGGPLVHDSLTHGGFRRSQNIAYRPACDGCAACVSARLPVGDYVFSRSERRVLSRNAAGFSRSANRMCSANGLVFAPFADQAFALTGAYCVTDAE